MKTGVGFLQDGQVIEGKDLRPCHAEYRLPSASAATSTSCLLQAGSFRRSWRRWRGSARSFAATVWVGGNGQLDVQGIRVESSLVMSAVSDQICARPGACGEHVRSVSALALRAAAPWLLFALRRGRLDEGLANSRSCARRALARGYGITSAHATFHLRDLQVRVELDGDQRAVGLFHVHLVRAVTGVGLDPVDGATRNGLERRRTERRGSGARYALFVGPDRLSAAGSRRPGMTAGG